MANNIDSIKIWEGGVDGYRLLDSGNRKKLEEITGQDGAKFRIVRTEPRAWWKPRLGKEEWHEANESFETVIDVGVESLKAKIKYKKSSKHIGIFPEQSREWNYISTQIRNFKSEIRNGEVNVLNLFGYTGMASLVAAKSGAKVTHVDASNASIDWARENQRLSGLEKAPIRWILDDALKFINKEISRSIKYDAIIMDPPSYGKGPKGEVWKIEEKLPELLKACREILSDTPLFIIFNMYSTELSSISVTNLLNDITKDLGGKIEAGELVIPHHSAEASRHKHQNSERLLPMSIFAIWEK